MSIDRGKLNCINLYHGIFHSKKMKKLQPHTMAWMNLKILHEKNKFQRIISSKISFL